MSDALDTFLAHWSAAKASERANAQQFLVELADLLDVPRPSNSHASGYTFEFPVRIPRGDGTSSEGRIDLYRRACFVLEAKQFAAPQPEQSALSLVAEDAGLYTTKKKSGPLRGSEAWDEAMFRARGQAERYARSLPADEPSPPFLLVVDVGHSIEIYADFTQAGKAYLPFPDPRSFRIRLADLRDDKVRERLRLIWLDPLSLDPAKRSAAVTREIAGYLATLASSLEKTGHPPRLVAEFLTRCLFCMFAEDVGLLPKDGFRGLLESLRGAPEGFVPKLRTLFGEMQTGTDFSVILNKKLLRFNGGLFEDASVLPLDGTQLGILILASKQEWREVEPAIFGTLLERALDPDERHQLGAHYTPRAYVERLVLPTVIEPLRAEWDSVRAAALLEARAGRIESARTEILRFHTQLCETTVLDPACGSGNFLYVTLEHLKRLEGEVLDIAAGFGETTFLDLDTHSVDPHQFLGIELNPRAASLAELVLWIGYLQWHFRTRGQTAPAEPVLKKFRNIENRDAVLAWDGDPVPVVDENGKPKTRWDGITMKTNPVTGDANPDESATVAILGYPNARPAEWPKADYIVGNPPFLGTKRMRDALGDGYVATLRKVYSEAVEDNADFVMYWWQKAATLLRAGEIQRFGLITTNSLRQTFNRRVVQKHLGEISMVFAIPDHPWVDTAEGAAVRIAMTVAESGACTGELRNVTGEEPHDDGSAIVTFEVKAGRIAADLSVGANVASVNALKANDGVCGLGVALHGAGFILEPQQAEQIRKDGASVIKPYLGGSDLLRERRERYLIDFSFMSESDARHVNPRAFQHVIDHVRPERIVNNREAIRRLWWRYGWERPEIRKAMAGLARFIGTTETAKHRVFQFIDGTILPDHMVIVIASDDAFQLGVLISRIHVVFALAAGGTLEDRPRYNKTRCFDPFPFPACTETAKTRIRALGEELDAHRKRVQTLHPGLSLTAMYNVLEALRAGRALTAKEQATHDAGLVSVLRQLHDELDAAVFAAYGWNDLWEWHEEARKGSIHDFQTGTTAQLAATPEGIDTAIAAFERALDAEILTRLVALNAQRAEEEANGHIRWLRPEYQNPPAQPALDLPAGKSRTARRAIPTDPGNDTLPRRPSSAKTPWPRTLAERVRAVETALQAAAAPITAATLASRFARAKPADIAEILETLATLGRAQRDGDSYSS